MIERLGLVAAAMSALSIGVCAPAWAAGPPDVTGQKYGDASGTLSGAGFSPVISTTVGDRKAWSDCVVTMVRTHDKPPPQNSTGSVTHQALVSLNCDEGVASATKPGNSAASAEGKAAIAQAQKDAAAAGS